MYQNCQKIEILHTGIPDLENQERAAEKIGVWSIMRTDQRFYVSFVGFEIPDHRGHETKKKTIEKLRIMHLRALEKEVADKLAKSKGNQTI